MDRYGTDEGLVVVAFLTRLQRTSCQQPSLNLLPSGVEFEGMRKGRGEGKERLKKDEENSTQSEIKSLGVSFALGPGRARAIIGRYFRGKMSIR